MIISDISKREIITDSLEFAKNLEGSYKKYRNTHSVEISQLALSKYKVTITYKVGDYFDNGCD